MRCAASDPVSNVRLAACELLPALKKMIRVPLDTYLLRKVEDCAASLAHDKDVEVAKCGVEVWVCRTFGAPPSPHSLSLGPGGAQAGADQLGAGHASGHGASV